ncbi:MAG: hypothetical protein A3K19_20175 [Lentisphaerae bacterium RIFOXYB12_FULL_65_16]|nr:MAG: hypothetical protein A3K18_11255 [Lentisphaerae bacterium RIFOXYA12_64_32]OGV91779.1 MAG: hypothetical protein A3K19_20175 [Lentisphaerae bacterium RIFOXYB12_FULL_65_16]
MSVDLSRYLENVLASEDRPLLEEADLAAKAGALRGAYVLVWLACAESLKRRFREAQKRDGNAGKIVGDIETKEKEHKAVDKLVLDKAKEYGFIDDTAYAELFHVYEMRCVYGHPYEVSPLAEQLVGAAAVVSRHVLSQPVKLKHGFAQRVLTDLFEDPHYLDDSPERVREFAAETVSRIDGTVHAWLLKECCKRLEPMIDDASVRLFARRGKCFAKSALEKSGCEILDPSEWHAFAQEYPKSASSILTAPSLFPKVGTRAQDYIIGSILEQGKTHPTRLRLLESASQRGLLSDRQTKRFEILISEKVGTGASRMTQAGAEWLRSSGLRLKTVFRHLIQGLESHTWYHQNPIADMVRSEGPEGVSSLTEQEQEELGRNILQSADGGARSSLSLLEAVGKAEGGEWPACFVRGILAECFVNERGQIRFKTTSLDKALGCLWSLGKDKQKTVIEAIAESIGKGTPKRGYVDKGNVKDMLSSLPAETKSGRAPLRKLRDAISRIEAKEGSD